MTTLLSRAALAAAAMALGLSGAHATTYQNTATATMAVSLTVQSPCAVSVSPLAFGSSALANAANASAAISVTCGSGTPYSVTLDNGQHSVSGQREMTTTSNGGGNVVYNLYSDSNRTIPWAAAGVGGTGNGSAQTITVYGQVPAAGGATVGSYSDSVGVTVNY